MIILFTIKLREIFLTQKVFNFFSFKLKERESSPLVRVYISLSLKQNKINLEKKE